MIPSSAGLVFHPRGTVGVVAKSPADHEHSYRVRFPDGFEASLKRNEVAMLAQFKPQAVATGRRVDRCGIVADDVSWGHRVSPDCGLTVSGATTATQSIIAAAQRKKIYCKATARQCQNGAR